MMLIPVLALLQMSPVIQTDDGRLLRDARRAQVRFETVRRAHLPRDRSGGSPGRCDAQIGRYCYWYDSTRLTAVPEPRQITEARSALIGQLDSAAARNPADAWIAGQRVRYLIEGGRFQDAVSAARGCRADDWW